MTWAVLFLVVAYSPIGRPDLYVGTSYYINNQGVNFKGGIANAPKGMAYATEEEDSEIEDYAPASEYNADYGSNSSEYSPQKTTEDANYSSASESNQGSGQSGSVILAGNSSKGSAQGTATAQSNDASSLSSDLSLTSSATNNRQTAAPNKPNGGRDPGGKNPKKPPIPVGDGVWLLLIMAGGYVFWRKHQTAEERT